MDDTTMTAPDTARMTVDTRLGALELVALDGHLTEIRLPGPLVPLPEPVRPSRQAGQPATPAPAGSSGRVLAEARRQLDEYFAGKRRAFDLPLDPRGTSFQRAVWDELREVPFGQTVTYGELARRVGRPEAARGVGAAMAANPLPIVVPCHRVVGSSGGLTGFGGGLPRKRLLLEIEGAARIEDA